MTMSIFVLNIASMLGLALAIDYSLFLVSRFREELANGREWATPWRVPSRRAARPSCSPVSPLRSASPD